MTPQTFERYVALGDSTTEGLDDPDGAGGYRGWANRLAEHIAAHQGSLSYANLGVRGRCARQIKEEQLGPALALRPDLATVVAGMNDLLRGSFDARAIAGDIGDMQRALVDRGCVVLTFTIPDISRRLAMGPFARMLSRRTLALDDEIRRVSAASGALLLDLAAHDLATDPRMWSRDRLHANAEGHARTAAALAQLLGLPGTDDSWLAPLPAPPPAGLRARIAEDLVWGRDHLVPWLWRRVRGRSAGDHRTAKRPSLAPMPAAPLAGSEPRAIQEPEVLEMGFGRNPHVAKAEAAELKATSAKDSTACEHAWREAGRLWERAADRETDPKRRQQYAANAERARAAADDPDAAPAQADEAAASDPQVD